MLTRQADVWCCDTKPLASNVLLACHRRKVGAETRMQGVDLLETGVGAASRANEKALLTGRWATGHSTWENGNVTL